MATPVTRSVHGWSQDKTRGFHVFYDQHKDEKFTAADGTKLFINGRPWGAVVERAADGAAMPMPVGPIQPLGWSAPWYPDQKYIVRSLGKIAQNGGALSQNETSNRFRIDYEAMRRDYAEAHQMYYDMMVSEHIRILPGQRVPAPGEPIPYQIVAIIGVPPKSPKIPEAAMAGNRWLLGQETARYNPETQRMEVQPDEALAALLVRSRVDILTNSQVRAVQGEQADELAEVKKMLNALLAERAKEQLMQTAPKKGRKATSTTPAGAE